MSYEIIAIIIGPLVAVFTVYMEYMKDLRIKLQDRKQLWLSKHYNFIQTDIRNILDNIHTKNKMVYNGAIQLTIGTEFKEGVPQIKITNNLERLTVEDTGAHLKFYSFYQEFIELYKGVEFYIYNLNILYNKFIDFVKNAINLNCNGIRPVEYLPSDYEGYYMEHFFRATIYYSFDNTDFKIDTTSGENNCKYFTFNYKINDAYYGIFFSKSKENVEIFSKSIMPNVISHFKDKLMNLGVESNKIDIGLDIIIHKILNISEDYNSGFPIKGECKNCTSIKSVKRLEELMPPN
jgi:hypothetical protein